MKLSRITLAVIAVLGAGLGAGMASSAFALDLYMDKKTKQLYAEPGPGRERLGSFKRVDDAAAASAIKTDTAESTPVPRDRTAAMREKMAGVRLVNDVAELKERVKETESVHPKFDDRGIHFATKDGNFTWSPNGRIQVASQYNFVNDPADPTGTDRPYELNSGMNIRRARMGMEGTFYKIWDYKFEFDFSRGNGSVASGITDAYVRLNHTDALSFKIGSFKEPFSLEEAASNRFITFIERHMAVNTFVDNPNTYKTGIGVNYAVPRWQTGVAFQTEPVGGWSSASSSANSNVSTLSNGNQSRNNGSGDMGWEGMARVTGRPWMEGNHKWLHIGTSGGRTHVNTQYAADGSIANGGMSFFTFPGTNVDRSNILFTGNLSDGALTSATRHEITSYDRMGAETQFVYGPASLQGEYLRTNINGVGYNNGDHLTGAYVFGSLFLTGESKTYHVRNGAANRIRPITPFQWRGPGWGAWEIATGWDYIDMNSGAVKGGQMDMLRFGVNWYPHAMVKLQSNIQHVLAINTPVSGGTGYDGRRSVGWNHGNLDVFMTQLTVDF
ncbi:MAG: porin [Nitrosomonadaceae bacterium]|nr:porin [Nitrosomonadaceae bacterium]